MRTEFASDINETVGLIKENSSLPCAIGFGISTPDQAKKMGRIADGAIVGSAIVKICKEYGKDCVPHVAQYVKTMKDALKTLP